MPVRPIQFDEKAAFFVDQRLITQSEFIADVTHFQSQLQQLKPASQVVLFHPDTYQFAVRLFALATRGHTVILPPNGQPETLQIFLQQSAIFCGDDSHLLFTDGLLNIENQPAIVNPSSVELTWPSEAMVVFYTSGSSGQSKPIVKSWHVLNRELMVLSSSFQLLGRLTFISTVSHQHIYGLLFRLLWPLANGHIIDSAQLQYPEHIAQKLQSCPQAVLVSSPAQLARLCNDNVLVTQRASLQWLFSSGGPLNNEHAQTLYQQLKRPITQVYGSTETGGIAYRQVLDASINTPWQPFSGNHLAVDEQGRMLLNSYILQQKNVSLDDSATLLSNGQFHLLGRLDRTIKIEEKRLNLDELEAQLIKHEWVQEAKLIVVPAKRVQIGALVVLNAVGQQHLDSQGKLATNRLLNNFLSNRFERVCLPRKWRYIQALPYNSQAKLHIKTMEQYFAKPE